MAQPGPFAQAAEPIYALIDQIEDHVADGERRLADLAETQLQQFAKLLERHGVKEQSIAPARYGLAVLIDETVRQSRGAKLSTWSVLARRQLFDGRDMSIPRIRDFVSKARGAGADYGELAEFLDDVLARLEVRQSHSRPQQQVGWWGVTIASLMVFLLALAGYAAFLEYRFQAKVNAVFEQDLIRIGLDTNPTGRDLALRLTQLAQARDRVLETAEGAPLRGTIKLPGVDSGNKATAVYQTAVKKHVPVALSDALEISLATQGDGLELYDTLRAWAVLTGDTDWQPSYLQSWMAENQSVLGWTGFANHVAALDGPVPDIGSVDTEIMAQAIRFAAETSEADRVWLELRRSAGAMALEPWVPSKQIADLDRILVRRSGEPLSAPIEGLFTVQGWEYARDFGIGNAVLTSRRLAPRLLGSNPSQVNDTPDQVLDQLHHETIAVWKDWLADLRVRPFDNRETAIEVSGLMAQSQTPLNQLMTHAWHEMGGRDRSRTHEQQIELGREFGHVAQYIEQGGVDQLARLFSRLNVALAAADFDAVRGTEKLMNVRERADTVRVLQAAPRMIVEIAEDVLAQAGAAESQGGSDALTASWQKLVYPACVQAVNGMYPFADGPDAPPESVEAFFAPDGVLTKFFNVNIAHLIDQEQSPWRWKPEARFAGINTESAAFFEKALLAGAGLLNEDGQLKTNLTLAALAERGTTVIALGGQGAAVRATGKPAVLNWPGPEPDKGMAVSFREATQAADIEVNGHWGLLRLLDQFRLRFRDDGARALVDLRSNQGRIFVEMTFDKAANPVSVRQSLKGLICPPRL